MVSQKRGKTASRRVNISAGTDMLKDKLGILILIFCFGWVLSVSSQTTLHYPALESVNAFSNTNTFTKAIVTGINNIGNSGTSFNIDLSLGNVQQVTMTGNATATITNLSAGQKFSMLICQDATGSRTLAWPASFHGAMTIGAVLSLCSSQDFAVNAAGTAVFATNPGVVNQ